MGKREGKKSEDKELNAVRGEIKSKKLRWKAAKTKISRLSEEKRKNLLGALVEKEEVERIQKKQEKKRKQRTRGSLESGSVDPPPEWDWRNVAGNDWTTPIKDQGYCGSCVAFGVIGALEMMIKKWVYNDPAVDPTKVNFSEAHLYFCNNRRCTYAEGNYGWWIDKALDYLKANGVPDECCFPYYDQTLSCDTGAVPIVGTCSDWTDRVDLTKIKDWKAVTDITEMKKLLSEHGCLVTRFAVYTDFFYYTGGVYEQVWGNYEGGHAVTVVGYSDVDDCWICKNSWGTCWGESGPYTLEGGWFRIAYDEVGIDDTMYKIELVCPAEASAVTMGFDQKTIKMVRNFRDRLLHTRRGGAYLYSATKDIGAVTRVLHILKTNEQIRKEAVEVLRPFIEAVSTIDEKEPLNLEAKHFKAASVVLDKIAKADPKLIPTVSRIKQEIPLYVGKNLKQIMREL